MPKTIVATSRVASAWQWLLALFPAATVATAATTPTPPVAMAGVEPWNTWAEVMKRQNAAVCVRLVERASGQRFVVATYHMPCLFGSDEKCQVMVAHAALLMQRVQRFAQNDPLVV